MTDTDPYLAVSLEKLQRLLEVSIAENKGSFALLFQRLDQTDGKHEALAKRVEELEDKVTEVDKAAVTNEQLKDRTRFILTIVTALVAVVGGILGAIQFFGSP